ncbi:MAG TPA: DUF2993 domain-containing protein [Fimbriimonadales bacterium]|nr:DUF2993 domain-containing protein [Fimbriimonadales bacterium]
MKESAVKATELCISTKGIVLPNGLRIAEARVSMPQLTLRVSPFLLPEGTNLDIELVAESMDLQEHLNAKSPAGISDIRVRAERGSIIITGIYRLLVPIPVGAEGVLEFENGKLNFVLKRAEVAGVKAPENLVREQIEKINPIVDLTGYPVQAEIKSIEIGNGKIRINANLSLTAPVPRKEP